jgi:hypothetical protein
MGLKIQKPGNVVLGVVSTSFKWDKNMLGHSKYSWRMYADCGLPEKS